jgi:hypothetical protein
VLLGFGIVPDRENILTWSVFKLIAKSRFCRYLDVVTPGLLFFSRGSLTAPALLILKGASPVNFLVSGIFWDTITNDESS